MFRIFRRIYLRVSNIYESKIGDKENIFEVGTYVGFSFDRIIFDNDRTLFLYPDNV